MTSLCDFIKCTEFYTGRRPVTNLKKVAAAEARDASTEKSTY